MTPDHMDSSIYWWRREGKALFYQEPGGRDERKTTRLEVFNGRTRKKISSTKEKENGGGYKKKGFAVEREEGGVHLSYHFCVERDTQSSKNLAGPRKEAESEDVSLPRVGREEMNFFS